MVRNRGESDEEKIVRRSRRMRALSEAEDTLWQTVTRDARPLRALPRPRPLVEPAKTQAQTKAVPVPEEKSLYRFDREIKAPIRSPGPPPLTGLDRRTSQKLARGQIEADARLDLHGMRLEQAEGALFDFLTRTRARGARCVLVITGKGESPFARHTLHGRQFYEVPEHAGVLRSNLPRWLNDARFRTLVAGFQPAHPRHGGGGAFYIWLRKRA